MKRIAFYITFNFIFFLKIVGQNLPVEVISTVNCSLKDGIFLTFEMFKKNEPLPFSNIATEGNPNSLNFILDVMSSRSIFLFSSNGAVNEFPTSSLWGFCKDCNIYVNVGGLFFFLPHRETLSRIPEKIPEKWFSDKVENSNDATGREEDEYYQTFEEVELIVDLRTGTTSRFIPEDLILLMASDDSICKEYQKLSKRKQKKRKLRYLNRFNQRNPLNL